MGAIGGAVPYGEKSFDIAFTMGDQCVPGKGNLQLIIKDARDERRLKERCAFMESSLQTILDNIKKYSPNANTDGVVRAYEFAIKRTKDSSVSPAKAYVHHRLKSRRL